MTGTPLPDDGEERDIFLVALAKMSDECHAPELTPECPFSIDLPAGGRGCGAECEDLLAVHGPVARSGEVELPASGITARPRPRPSKSPVAGMRAFDATEQYYRDSDQNPVSSWSPAALLVALRRSATTHPFTRTVEQHDETEACLQELAARQFDVPALVHGPLADHVASALIADVLTRTMRAVEEDDHEHLEDSRVGLRNKMYERSLAAGAVSAGLHVGLSTVTLDEDTTQRIIYTVAGEFAHAVQAWARAASIETLFDWNLDVPSASPVAFDLTPVDRQAQWLFDRFTETYTEKWEPESLRIEWRHRRGGVTVPMSSEQMATRLVDPIELASQVADLESERPGRLRAHIILTVTAVELLKAGHRAAAVALFDSVRQTDWDDGMLHNNYGFCLMPDAPAEALRALELATKQGFDGPANRANRVLCLFRLGKLASSLELLDEAMENWADLDTGESFLWDFAASESQPELLDRVCPRCYLVKLGAHIGAASGDAQLQAKWDRRARNLVHQDS